MDFIVDAAIKTVINHFKGWSPDTISGLFWDREDYKGLVYWYEFVLSITPTKKK